jgi:hypothetical protein
MSRTVDDEKFAMSTVVERAKIEANKNLQSAIFLPASFPDWLRDWTYDFDVWRGGGPLP